MWWYQDYYCELSALQQRLYNDFASKQVLPPPPSRLSSIHIFLLLPPPSLPSGSPSVPLSLLIAFPSSPLPQADHPLLSAPFTTPGRRVSMCVHVGMGVGER